MKNNYSEAEILQVLAERVKKYTSNESTSISYDKARQLMSSILYCMEEDQQYELEEQESAVLCKDKEQNASETFKMGLTKKKKKITAARKQYQDLCKSFCAYQNTCYNDTIIPGMVAFFERYDVEFDASNHILTLDYPLLYPVSEQVGIDLIYKYLQRTQIEQNFLNKFSSDRVIELLNGYQKEHSELIISICKLVLRNVVACVLLDKSVYELVINEEDKEILKQMGDHKSLKELEVIIGEALDKMILEEFENDRTLLNYLKQDVKEFAFEYKTCAENGCLEKLFLGKREEKISNKVIFEDGASMDDEALRELLGEIDEMKCLSDKLQLVKMQVRSLEDLKELLEECFYEGEYESLFELLSPEEMKVLKKGIVEKLNFDENLYEWEEAFMSFVRNGYIQGC